MKICDWCGESLPDDEFGYRQCYPEFGCQVIEARAQRIEAAAREVVDALNFYESTLTQAYRNEQRPHVMDACRRLREALDG